MAESDDRDHEVDERLGEPTSYSLPQNLNPRNTPIHVTGLYPGWQSNLSSQSQQESPQFDYNQNYTNMAYYQPNFQMAPYPNMFFQQTVGPPQHQTTQPMFQQPVGPLQQQNTQPTFQQPVGPPQHQTTQPTVNVSASQHTMPPSALKANPRGNKNWTKEEDIQLTIAWLRISTDPVVGVGQKKDTLYDRILKLFVKLMHESHQMKPEDCTRTAHALDNRMSEIKSQCSRWTATRAQVLGSYKSGWSPEDIEKLCLETHKGQGKGAFKWKECWEILRVNPKWHDYLNTKSADDSQRTARKRAKRTQPSLEPQMEPQTGESIPNDTSDTMETQTPCTPSISSMCSEPEVRENGRGACTPNLDGPASIEIERPPGTTISKKPKNQRQRRLKKHSESVASASQSITASLMNLESASTYQWEKLGEENRKRDLKDEERLDDMKRKHDLHIDLEHDMKVGNERSTSVQDSAIIGEKLIAAIQLLDQMDPLSLVTNNQRRLYELRKKAVDHFENQYAALEVLLSRSKVVSTPSVPAKENVESVGTSQRRLFDENEVCLGQDS